MEALDLGDLELLFAGCEQDASGHRRAIMEAFGRTQGQDLSWEERATQKLQRLLEDPALQGNIPLWMKNDRHKALAMKLVMDAMFMDGMGNKRSFSLRVVQGHYRNTRLTIERGNS